MKRFIGGCFPLIPCAQFLGLCGNIRQSLRELGLVLLGLSTGDLRTQGAQIALLLGGVGTVIPCRLIIALAQFHQPLLHLGSIHARKLLGFQA